MKSASASGLPSSVLFSSLLLIFLSSSPFNILSCDPQLLVFLHHCPSLSPILTATLLSLDLTLLSSLVIDLLSLHPQPLVFSTLLLSSPLLVTILSSFHITILSFVPQPVVFLPYCLSLPCSSFSCLPSPLLFSFLLLVLLSSFLTVLSLVP